MSSATLSTQSPELINERLFEVLIAGDRQAARQLVTQLTHQGFTPQRLLSEVFWPSYETIDKLHRSDQLSTLAHHMATRLLRVMIDQNAAAMPRKAPVGRTIYVFCGAGDADEMGAQMAVDLLEANGFTTHFAGGGIANDEILSLVNNNKPDVLLMFASAPGDLPNIRELIDNLTEIGACPNTQIAVGAGVFNRADGLAEEIGADIWASDPQEMVETLIQEPARRAAADQRTVGKSRTKRKAA
jgi:MerR family transcriptional regulator, light-induced transcriptional regulator